MKHPFTLDHCWEVLREHPTWKKAEMPTFFDQDASRKKPKTSETGSDVPEDVEPRNKRPIGHDAAKKSKKKATETNMASFLDGVADKWKSIKTMALGKKQQLADGYYEIKRKELEQRNRELALEEKKLEQRERDRKFQEEEKYEKDIIFYCTPIDPALPELQRQKMQELKDKIKKRHNLDY